MVTDKGMTGDLEAIDISLFKEKFRGIPAHKVAMAMTRLQHGIDFARCSKEMMAESWAARYSRFGHKNLQSITLGMIYDKIGELYADRSTMHVPQKRVPEIPTVPLPVRNIRDELRQAEEFLTQAIKMWGTPTSHLTTDITTFLNRRRF
jgi:hypothetical protein